MTVAVEGMRAMSDEELLAAFRSDEQAAEAYAEAQRRDQAGKAARAREQIRAEWYDAAYQQYLTAEQVCRGNLLSRDGIASGIAEPFSLWHGPAAVAMKYASEELRDFWAASPRLTIGEYARRMAIARRAAREDTATEEASNGDRMAANRRPAVDGHGAGTVQPGGEAGADESVRADRRAREAEAGPATGPVRPARRQRIGGEAVDTDPIVAGANDANRRQTVTGQVVRRPASQAARPPAKPIDGAMLADLADKWIRHHCYLTDSARHAITLWVMAQHFRTPGENPAMIWPKFPHVLLVAETPGSGKTTAMKTAGYLCQPYFMGIDNNPTAPGLCLSISQENAALFIDEAHRLVGAKGTRKADVVTIMCASFEQDATYPNARGGKINRVPVYTPMMIAAKKDPFLTSAGEEISDVIQRSDLIFVTRPPEGTKLTPVDGKTREDGAKLAQVMAAWASADGRQGHVQRGHSDRTGRSGRDRA